MNTTGAINEQIFEFARRWQLAEYGTKEDVMVEAIDRLGLSRGTLYRKFGEMVATGRRKRRSDAGSTSLSREDAVQISAVLMEHMRKNGKRIKSVGTAVDECRACKMIKAEYVDPATGEVRRLSNSAIQRGLRLHMLHPDQLLRPEPAISMSSKYPNHVWQIDASRCVMCFLPKARNDNGMRLLSWAYHDKFYKNKPANQIRMIRDSLWRYVVTDHRSGWIYVDYVTGGESSENLINTFVDAMAERAGEAMHGVPNMIMLDPGSANTSATFKNLCSALQVRLQINAVGHPRAKGQVEKSNDIVERGFESMLKTLPDSEVRTLEQVSSLAQRWRKYFNGTMVMRRHGMTRDAAWLHITPEQLVEAPPAELMLEVARTAPESRVVSDFLRVSFLGKEYDVSHVPNVQNGEKLLICRNIMVPNSAQAIVPGRDGRDEFHVLPLVVRDEFGQTGPVIGEAYESHAQTPAQRNAMEVELTAMSASTMEEAKAKRKAKSAFMDGRYSPFALMDQTPVPTPISRTGTAHEMSTRASQTVLPPLTHIQAAKALRPRFDPWTPRHYQWVVDHYPEGVPADGVDAAEAALRIAMTPRVLPLTRVA